MLVLFIIEVHDRLLSQTCVLFLSVLFCYFHAFFALCYSSSPFFLYFSCLTEGLSQFSWKIVIFSIFSAFFLCYDIFRKFLKLALISIGLFSKMSIKLQYFWLFWYNISKCSRYKLSKKSSNMFLYWFNIAKILDFCLVFLTAYSIKNFLSSTIIKSQRFERVLSLWFLNDNNIHAIKSSFFQKV